MILSLMWIMLNANRGYKRDSQVDYIYLGRVLE